MKYGGTFSIIIIAGVSLFALAGIVQGFTANGKRVVSEGDPITLFKTYTSARTVTDAEKVKWTFANESSLRKITEEAGAPLWMGGAWPAIPGTALSAARLTTPRNINGVPFDGTANITIVDTTKEPLISGGIAAQYLRGDKSLGTFAIDALAAAPAETATTIKSALGITTLSGSNTGDDAANSLYSGLVSNATHTGDATGSTALTVSGINGTSLAGLSTGLLKNTSGTGAPSIAVAGSDYLAPSGSAAALTGFPDLNQNTTGSAAKFTTARAINGVNFDGTTPITINAVDSTARALLAGSASQAFSASTLNATAGITSVTGGYFAGTSGNIIIGGSTPLIGSKLEVQGPLTGMTDLGVTTVDLTSAGSRCYTHAAATYAQLQVYNGNVTAYKPYVLQPEGSNVLVGTLTDNGNKMQIVGTLSVNGTNIVYYCNGGTNAGLLGRGNAGPCPSGAWVATSLKID
jgi:hypothetical protein